MERKIGAPRPLGIPVHKELPPASPMSRIEMLARSPKYADQARKSLRQDYDAFKKGGEAAVQNRHHIETRYFESRSPAIARAIDKGTIGRPIGLILLRYFPHLVEKQIEEIVSACFAERLPGESVEAFRQKRASARLNLVVTGLDAHDTRAIVSQCVEMMEAYKILERRGIRDASSNWPKRHDGTSRSMMINRLKLVALSYNIYKDAHPDTAPELRKDLPVVKYEHRDVKGKVIGILYAQYRNVGVWEATKNFLKYPHVVDAIKTYGIESITKKMCSLIIEIPKTGKKIDLLRMTGQENAQIFIIDTPKPIDGIKVLNSNMVFAHEPKTAHQLFALLHEFGHNDQELDLGFQNVSGNFSAVTAHGKNIFAFDVEKTWKDIGRVCTQGKHRLRDQIITVKDSDEALLYFKEVNRLLVRYGHRPLDWSSTSDVQIKEANAFLIRHASEEFLKMDTLQNIRLKKASNFFAWRRRFMERDASRRALQWFRQLRREGADFFQQMPFSLQDAFMLGFSYQTLSSVLFNKGATLQDVSRNALASQQSGNQGMRDFYKEIGIEIRQPKKKK